MAPSLKRIAPRHGRITPEMVRSSVDLPAPFEPSTATISPAPHGEIDAAQDFRAAVAGVQAVHREQGLRPWTRSGGHPAAAPWPR